MSKMGFSEEKTVFFDELEQRLKLSPDYQKVRDRYRIISNSEKIVVQRRSCLGFWVAVRSSCLTRNIGGDSWCAAMSVEDAKNALIENIEEDVNYPPSTGIPV
jgi:hypothetical protein